MLHYIYPFTFTFLDYPNPEDAAILVMFLQCEHNCPGCQNPQFQDLSLLPSTNIKTATSQEFLEDLRIFSLRSSLVKVVLSGGDPLHPANRPEILEVLRSRGEFEFCVYTGYDSEEIPEIFQDAKVKFDFLICGKYNIQQRQESLKTDDFFQLASKNQKIYDKTKTLISFDGRISFS